MDLKLIVWVVSILLTIYAYYSYIKSIFDNKTKPHIFSWLIWSLSTTVVFLWQLIWWGWYWTFWSGAIAFFVVFIFLLSLKYWEKSFSKIDIISLIVALIALLIWYFTKTPLYSVILLVFMDAVWFIPTFIKTYKEPFSEDIQIYFITWLIYLLSFLSLETYSLLTMIWPVVIWWINFIFVLFALYFRKKIEIIR